MQTSEKVASDYDCADAFQKYSDCVTKGSTCSNQHYSVDCGTEETAYGACVSAASAHKGDVNAGSVNNNNSGGGGAWCDQLKAECDVCNQATSKAACNTIVNAQNETYCKSAVQSNGYSAGGQYCK
jgi:hypothetical protein